MNPKQKTIDTLLQGRSTTIQNTSGRVYAPANIALCKYWGKRDADLNLPLTPSLSVSLGPKGSYFGFQMIEDKEHQINVNGIQIEKTSAFYQRLVSFLNLFPNAEQACLQIDIESTIPIAAGLASSASGFASVVKALNELYGWQLSLQELSILARLGSGSACRSLWPGFVEWQMGERADGLDSHGVSLPETWPEFRLGLHLISTQEKSISSREAMEITRKTARFFKLWPEQVEQDFKAIQNALSEKDFKALGQTAESNALALHAMMLNAVPAISYTQPHTLMAMQKIWALRAQGLALYFTQDAGPNLKLLFLEPDRETVLAHFPELDVVAPFAE